LHLWRDASRATPSTVLAFHTIGWQAFQVHAVINNEEFIGKTVGRRKNPADSLTYVDGLQRTVTCFAPTRIKRGVYKFHTHEEADQWLTDHLIRKQEI
jgi:hypothetical protein